MTDTRDSVISELQALCNLRGHTLPITEYRAVKEAIEMLTALQAGAGDGEDTARIDYLETLRGDMITGTSDDQELIGHDWVIYGQFYTAREALDYGMMKRQEAIDNAQATEGK